MSIPIRLPEPKRQEVVIGRHPGRHIADERCTPSSFRAELSPIPNPKTDTLKASEAGRAFSNEIVSLNVA